MTFCDPIDHLKLKKCHGLSALLLHCESQCCACFVVDFEFVRLMGAIRNQVSGFFRARAWPWGARPTKEFGFKSHPWVV
mgnify:CR=1 FL=1